MNKKAVRIVRLTRWKNSFVVLPSLLRNTVIVGHHIAHVNKTHVAVVTFNA
jgi:hypothetical protein